MSNMCVLIARTLMKHIPYFSEYGKGVEKHIRHQFYEEMSRKSEVVCDLMFMHTMHMCIIFS
jgi:hypothetical protein